MRRIRIAVLLFVLPWISCAGPLAAEPTASEPRAENPSANSVAIRIAAYNVMFGGRGTPEAIGEMLRPLNLDVVGFCEVPGGDWTARCGKVLGMEHVYIGEITSANHKEKYKSILSRTPLSKTREVRLTARGKHFWNPASAVRAETTIRGVPLVVISLHICGNGLGEDGPLKSTGHSHELVRQLLAIESRPHVVAVGDYNNRLDDSAMKVVEDAGFRNTWRDLSRINMHQSFTYAATRNRAGVIDHLLYKTGPGIQATDGGIIEHEPPLSDHKPVWAEIAFPETLP